MQSWKPTEWMRYTAEFFISSFQLVDEKAQIAKFNSKFVESIAARKSI